MADVLETDPRRQHRLLHTWTAAAQVQGAGASCSLRADGEKEGSWVKHYPIDRECRTSLLHRGLWLKKRLLFLFIGSQ